jgi:O-antigen/teichoic acid export membrane protein
MINRLKNKLYNGRLKGLFATDGTLSQKAARSGVWVFGSFGFSKVLNFVQMIILARLLMPEDFGLMGICYVAIGAMAVFTETGFNAAVIQRKEHNDDVLNTAWVISVLRGLVLFSLLFFLSPVIAGFYENAQIEPILKVIAFSFMFYGFNNVGLILFSKELDFKKKVVYEQITAISTIIITVVLAFMLRNVWALVLGHIAGAIIGTSLSFWVHPFRPKFKFKIDIAKELFHFGKHVFLSGALIFLITQGDDALIGKVLGLSALGLYYLAYKVSNLPATAISHVISSVSFPAYAKVQDDPARLKKGYLRILNLTLLLSIPIAAIIFILAPELISILYGEKWLPIIPALQILCLFGITRAINSTFGAIFQASGNPKYLSKTAAIQLISLIIIIYPLALYGNIAGVSIAVTISNLIALMFCIKYISSIININFSQYFKELLPYIVGAFVIFVFIFIFKKFVFDTIYIFNLLLLILLGLIAYGTYIYVVKRNVIIECYNTVKSL